MRLAGNADRGAAAVVGGASARAIHEAHSSQTGESTKSLKAVLATKSLEEAEKRRWDAETPEEEMEDRILEEMQRRADLPNLSLFAFTATPKAKTLELFGISQPDGTFGRSTSTACARPLKRISSSMCSNYTTYKSYWRLLKTIEEDPRYDKNKAVYLLKSFVELHPHAIGRRSRSWSSTLQPR